MGFSGRNKEPLVLLSALTPNRSSTLTKQSDEKSRRELAPECHYLWCQKGPIDADRLRLVDRVSLPWLDDKVSNQLAAIDKPSLIDGSAPVENNVPFTELPSSGQYVDTASTGFQSGDRATQHVRQTYLSIGGLPGTRLASQMQDKLAYISHTRGTQRMP